MTASAPILYSFRRCPYAMRARMALSVSQQSCALREVVLRNKPQEMLTASPKGTVPVLVLGDGQVIDESFDIMKWALARHDPAGWLTPSQGDLADMEALIEECDGAFKHHLDRYKYANRHDGADAESHRSAGMQFLTKLDKRLSDSAFLFGDRLSLADVAIAPFVRQFVNTDNDWFAAQDLPHVQAWLAGFLASPLFQGVMEKYEPWAPGDAEPLFP